MEKSQKTLDIFTCNYCHYKCCKKYDYSKHILTAKHQNRANLNSLEQKVAKCRQKYICKKCNKKYSARNSLWYHEQKCLYTEDIIENKIETNKNELIDYLIKENKEIKELILEIIKKDTYNTINNTTTNSHNKTFNLQFFLNETCKDAMNIMDFVDSIKLQLSDLENVGKLGYVEGISNIIIQNLNAMDVHKRPVHCADKKREVLYIKDENKWEKENDDKKKIRQAIRRVAAKNQRLIPSFKEAHPDCNKYHSKFSDQYNKIIVESMGGSGDNDIEKEDKIIRNISKNIVIDKV